MDKRLHSIFIVMTVILACTVSAYAADWTQKDVSDVAEKVKAGKPVYVGKAVPADQTQVIDLYVQEKGVSVIRYRIDLRAKLCYLYFEPLTPVPCKAIKDGYPMFAPLIDWEK